MIGCLKNSKIAFIGAGPMAEAIISGLVKSKLVPADHIYVQNHSNKNRLLELQNSYNINIDYFDITMVDVVVLATQPKDIQKVIDTLNHKFTTAQTIISVVTSVTTEYIEDQIGIKPQVIRVMPNTSSMVGESATALTSGKYTSKEAVQLAMEIFRGIGDVYQIKEDHMDIFTGIAGSAPAFFYSLMQQMEQIAIHEGLPKNLVRYIIAQTVYGSAKMVLEQEESFAELIKNVAAPNGPTAAGLDALEQYGGNKAIVEAVKATTVRSKEMGEPFSKQATKN